MEGQRQQMTQNHIGGEFVDVLNSMNWEPQGGSMVAEFDTDNISKFGELVFQRFGVVVTILDLPDGYLAVLHQDDLPRFAEEGVCFPWQADVVANLDSAVLQMR